ncbi:hypothetical protein PHET_00815 [Paragonimus heterotremus]|uniref:Protein kinase domain-containing protein n=1 Tax=Paragonimus heterotremus TaxID=100268 RepID=A0A8J4SUM3_9TREM|nr:hypothetical protein PHET_00815 [Paragonimus heterotremus]
MSRLSLRRNSQCPNQEVQNPAAQLANIDRAVGHAGPDLVWRVHDAKLIKTGQLTDALRFLHSTQEMMHCNINPNAILIATGYKWKLGGLYFLEKIVDTTKTSPKFAGYSTKFPRASQPNLDYIAPEAQLYNSMSPLADMFSLGMVLCAIHNDGRSLIEADNNPNVYIKKLPETSIVLMDLIEFFISRLNNAEVEKFVIPEFFVCLEPATLKTVFRALMDMLRLMLDTIDRHRTCELILEDRKLHSGSCTNISSSAGVIRNLPLIAMQKPTIDGEMMVGHLDEDRYLRSSFYDARRRSGDEVGGGRGWNRTNLQLQRLRSSQNRSETFLCNMKHRNSLSSSDRSNWNEISSNPAVGYRTSSNPSSRNGCSPSFIPSPLAGDIPIIRRHSGNLPTRCVTSQVSGDY